MADYLSHLKSGEPAEGIPDDLSDAEIFGISPTPSNPFKDKWIKEMTHLLSISLPPEHTCPSTRRNDWSSVAECFAYFTTHYTSRALMAYYGVEGSDNLKNMPFSMRHIME